MTSTLENTLLRCGQRNDYVCNTLFSYLDDGTLRRLRTVSKTFFDLIDRSPTQLFRTLYIKAPFPENRYVDCLENAAPHCHELVIRVYRAQDAGRVNDHMSRPDRRHSGTGQGAPSPRRSARERWRNVRQALASRPGTLLPSSRPRSDEQSASLTISRPSTSSDRRSDADQSSQTAVQHAWDDLLAHFSQLRSLTIECNGDPAWPGQTDLERTLIVLRIALENADMQYLRHVRLSPIHASGIIHLRWSGLGAFGSAPASASALWQNVHTLDLQIQNPFPARYRLTDSQKTMFKLMLHDYLRSFASTLKRLRFVWLDEEGPSPMALDLEDDLRGQRSAIIWPKMEELWLGSIEFTHRTIRALPERTPGAWKLRTLRVTHQASKSPFEDAAAWVDVLLGSQNPERAALFNRASSVYSQE